MNDRVADLRARFNASMISSGRRCCCTVETEPDELGRQRFALEWIGTDYLREGKVRGQHFFACVEDYVRFDP